MPHSVKGEWIKFMTAGTIEVGSNCPWDVEDVGSTDDNFRSCGYKKEEGKTQTPVCFSQ